MKKIILYLILAATCAASGAVQRSVVIEPYSKEKLQQLGKSVQAISGPAQELARALSELKQARDSQQNNDTPEAQVAVQKAMAICFDRISRFTESARKSKIPLTLGFEDLADYMEVNALALKHRNGNSPEMKKTSDYMQSQAVAIRKFSGDFDNMVSGMEDISHDLAQRSAGWVASSRVASTLSDVYGDNGIEGVYSTMSQVVDAMTELKGLFVTENPISGSFNSEDQKREQEAARKGFEDAMSRYHQQP